MLKEFYPFGSTITGVRTGMAKQMSKQQMCGYVYNV
jgi:hypothetical protein